MSDEPTDDASKAEQLLQQSKQQKRHTSEPEANDGTDPSTLVEAVADSYHRLDGGDLHQNLSLRDEDLAALVVALESADELSDVAARANDRLDRDAPEDSRADLLKALVRVGLHEVDDGELDAWSEGKRRFLTDSADVM